MIYKWFVRVRVTIFLFMFDLTHGLINPYSGFRRKYNAKNKTF